MHLKNAFSLLIAMTVAFASTSCLAWDHVGHEVVGAIADQELNGTPAGVHVRALLRPGESLESVSTWADCVKHSNLGYCRSDSEQQKAEWAQFREKVGKTAAGDYHFADIDVNSSYVFRQGQDDEDVVHGIRESISALKGERGNANPHNLTPREGLWLLTHLVGDITQPMHVAVIPINGDVHATLGGNWLYPSRSTCLHSEWDDKFVHEAMKRAKAHEPEEYAHRLIVTHPAYPGDAGDIMAWPIAWANDSVAVARSRVFAGIRITGQGEGTCGFGEGHPGWIIELPANYNEVAKATVDEQLWKGGSRLAEILRAIWPN